MALHTEGGRLGHRRGLAVAALLLLALPALGQPLLPLDKVSSRKAPDFSPAIEGQSVTVRGRVATPAFHFLAYTLLAVQSEQSGMVLQVPADSRVLDGFQAGDDLEAVGEVKVLAGMPVLEPQRLVRVGHGRVPAPERVPLADLQSFRYLGRVVETEGRVTEIGDTTAGIYLLISDGGPLYKIFVPHAPGHMAAQPQGYRVGDRVRAAGVALQYCPRAPYNRWFELLVHETGTMARLEGSWLVPPGIVAGAGVAILIAALVLWKRERDLRAQRERQRRIYQLGEEVLGSASAEAILKRVGSALPQVLGVTRVRMYLFNRAAKTLDGVASADSPEESIPLASPPGGTHAGAAACYHYRSLLSIPDIARSPFPVSSGEPRTGPRSLLFVPMFAQGEVTGVLELDQDNRSREFTADEQALAQHLANQMGVAVRLLDQRSVQEQLFRSEKLAAVGRLISGVVNELQSPLASIAELVALAQHRPHLCPAEREIAAIGMESQKASDIVKRLVSYAAEQVETRLVDVNGLLRALIEFREHDWRASGIKVRESISRDALCILGSQGQMEQVFLNLLVHAEQSLAEVEEKTISIRTSLLARRILVEIGYAAVDIAADDDAGAVLSVTRSVVAGHGGEVRLARSAGSEPRFEIDLPLAARERSSSAGAGALRVSNSPATALVIEPDDGAKRQLLALLSARSFRVVPVNNSDTGLELAQRLRFDVVLCSVHSPGLNWIELSERLQMRAGAFVLLSDGYDHELMADFQGEGRYVLPKPVQEADLDRILRFLEPSEQITRARTA